MKKQFWILTLTLIAGVLLSGCGFGVEVEQEPREKLDRSEWPTPVPPTPSAEPTPFPKSSIAPAESPADAAAPESAATDAAPPTDLDLQQVLAMVSAGQATGLDLEQLAGQLPPELLSQLDLSSLSDSDISALLAGLGMDQTAGDDAAALIASLNLDQTASGDVADVIADLGLDQVSSGTTTNLLNQASALSGLEPVAVLKTSTDQTAIRQGPGTTYGINETVEMGELGAVLGTDDSGDWLYIITIQNARGWIPQSEARIIGTLDEAPVLPPNPISLITEQVAAATSIQTGGAVVTEAKVDLDQLNPVATGRVSSNLLNMRQRPGPDYKLLGTLSADTEVAILGLNRDREWALVATADGKTGWVSMDFLDVTGSLANAPIYRTLEPDSASQAAPVVSTAGGATAAGTTAASPQPVAATASQPASDIPGDKSFAAVATANVLERVDLLAGPGPEFGGLAEITVDQLVTILAVNPERDWAFVRNPLSKYGWTPLDVLDVTDGSVANAQPVLTALVTSDNLQLLSGPGIFYEYVGPVSRNEFLSVVAANSGRNWVQVETVGGGTGWMQLRLINNLTGSLDDLPQRDSPAVAQAASAEAAPPAPSGPPSGKLVFQTSSGGNIMQINADGTGLSKITSGGIDPVLSPDGRQVAFTRWQGDIGTLWLASVDGSGERAVLGEMRKAKGPDWSPDGQQIVLNFQQGGQVNDRNVCQSAGSEIPYGRAVDIRFTIDDDGKPIVCFTLLADPHWTLRLVDLSDGSFEDKYGGQYAFRPAWDPERDWRVVSAAGNGLLATDVNNPDYRQQLTSVIGDGSPAFSPDGRFIAMTTNTNNSYDIFRMTADGGSRVKLTKTPLWEGIKPDQEPKQWNNVAPAWSPDGSRIAFLTDRTGRWEIWVMNADGSNQQPLFSDEITDSLEIEYNFVDERAISWR
jgi:uncharacterized protein YgiM (DUF1202 family)